MGLTVRHDPPPWRALQPLICSVAPIATRAPSARRAAANTTAALAKGAQAPGAGAAVVGDFGCARGYSCLLLQPPSRADLLSAHGYGCGHHMEHGHDCGNHRGAAPWVQGHKKRTITLHARGATRQPNNVLRRRPNTPALRGDHAAGRAPGSRAPGGRKCLSTVAPVDTHALRECSSRVLIIRYQIR